MSFSLNPSKGADFAAARKVCEDAYDAMAAQQVCHKLDKDAYFAAIDAAASKVTFDPSLDVVIALAGSASWSGAQMHDDPNLKFSGVNMSVGVFQTARVAHVQV